MTEETVVTAGADQAPADMDALAWPAPHADDVACAAWLAREAGRILLGLRGEGGKEAGKRGDRGAHEFLVAALARLRPDDAVLSEEGADDPVRLGADRVWIVDPLDGTREYGEPGRTDWAVHVALWSRGTLTAGAVALPARDAVLTSGADGHPPLPARPDGEPIRLAVSRSRPPALVGDLTEALGARTVPMGSAGVKAMSVVLGESDAYVHAGGQYEWDSAAPVAVARAAGLHTSRIDGSPLAYNREDPKLPDLVICRVEFAERILAALRPLV
ncbi:3'(2'),5'-bisphosphate nucleotidase CysQ [Uniformispora flossi]|uniref:3'(2'),5'-bisphosphate nucleotidase CysQ n=1 Tax=Uniformispora flossi TaxID=3390723 RepID=UPI003C2C8578